MSRTMERRFNDPARYKRPGSARMDHIHFVYF